MQLNKQQIETQEAILKRLYPLLSIEESKREYIAGIGASEDYFDYCDFGLSLPRILKALGEDIQNGHIETHLYKDGEYTIFTDRSNDKLCSRKLLNEDMTDCNLRQQEHNTQDILSSIFCK